MNVQEFKDRAAAGDVVIPVNEAKPWERLHVSRASFYRAMQRGEIPGVLRLGRKRLLSLPVFLAWLGVDDEATEKDGR